MQRIFSLKQREWSHKFYQAESATRIKCRRDFLPGQDRYIDLAANLGKHTWQVGHLSLKRCSQLHQTDGPITPYDHVKSPPEGSSTPHLPSPLSRIPRGEGVQMSTKIPRCRHAAGCSTSSPGQCCSGSEHAAASDAQNTVCRLMMVAFPTVELGLHCGAGCP